MKTSDPSPPLSDGARTAFVVLGMHRSGTSAMARVLSLCGATLPNDLMLDERGNEAGHWEPARIAEFNEHLLRSLGSSWDHVFGPSAARTSDLTGEGRLEAARALLRNEFGGASSIVLKEPRISRLLDLWRPALEQEGFRPVYIIMVRRPDEVALSLKARDGMHSGKAQLLWASYMSAVDRLTQGQTRVFVAFDRLLEDPDRTLGRIEAVAGLPLPRTQARLDNIAAFLRPEIKTSVTKPMSTPSEIEPVGRLYAYLLAQADEAPLNTDVPAEVAAWLAGLDAVLGPVLSADQEALTQLSVRHFLTGHDLDQTRARLAQADVERDMAGAAEAELRTEIARIETERDTYSSAQKASAAHAAGLSTLLDEAHRRIEAYELAARDPSLEMEALADVQFLKEELNALRIAFDRERGEADARAAQAEDRVVQLSSELSEAERRLADGEQALRAAYAELRDLPPPPPDLTEALAETQALLEAERTRHHEAASIANDEARAAAEELSALRTQIDVERGVAGRQIALAAAARDQGEQAVAIARTQHAAEMDLVMAELARTRLRVRETQAVLSAVKSSTTWRIMAPVRALIVQLRRGKPTRDKSEGSSG